MADRIRELEDQIVKLRKELGVERRKVPPQPVTEYTFRATDGSEVLMSQLFGGKSDLLVIHNMGRACPYCTLWADGINGLASHVANRAAFVLASPDDPDVLGRFALSRGWKYRTVSSTGTTFGKDMGFEPEPGKYWPGVSAFSCREDGSMVRTGRAVFGPGDEFCAAWPLFELLADGANGWEPQYTYTL